MNKTSASTCLPLAGFGGTVGPKCYYELWRVKAGVIYGQHPFREKPSGQGNTDTFAMFGCVDPCKTPTRGKWVQWGTAVFLPTAADDFDKVANVLRKWFRTGQQGINEACALASACQTPGLITDLNALYAKANVPSLPYFQTQKSVEREWDCCCHCELGTTIWDLS